MKQSHLALAAILLTGTVAGTAVALTPERSEHSIHSRSEHARHEARGDLSGAEATRDGARFRVADDHRRERHHDRKHHRHHDDDDDDDRGGRNEGRAGRLPATGPSDPTTPVPDNGLFQGKTRPKVEVN